MKKLIYIKDARYQKKVTLHMILDNIGNIGADYVWSIFELEAEGDLGDTYTYLEIEKAIKSKSGYCISWDKLKELANKFEQVINAVIVAGKDKDQITLHKNDLGNIFVNYPMAISILDGDFWEISSSDDNLINEFEKTI